MQMNQVAIVCHGPEHRDEVKRSLGLLNADWVKDVVRAEVSVRVNGEMQAGRNTAELEFCMAMGGTQFELIRYIEGPNWLNANAVQPGMIAHVGFHLDEGEHWPEITKTAQLVQEAWTVGHSNAEINKVGRRYHYRIYKVAPFTFFKFIKRLTVNSEEYAVENL